MAEEYIKIIRVTDTVHMVEWQFANGWKDMVQCESEHDARVYARGLEKGILSLRNLIGSGPRLDPLVEVPAVAKVPAREPVLTPGGAISYHETRTGSVKVKLSGEYVGSIVKNGAYWHYRPKGKTSVPGKSFSSIGQVKYSLEN